MDDNVLLRVMPHDNNAEMNVIGSMMMDSEALSEGASLVKEEDFYNKQYRQIFTVMKKLYSQNDPADIVTINNELKNLEEFKNQDPLELIKEIALATVTSANIKKYCQIVKNDSQIRKYIRLCDQIASDGYSGTMTAAEIAEKIEKGVFDIHSIESGTEPSHIKDTLIETLTDIEEASKIKGNISGIPTGFSDFDNLTGGFQNGELIILAARPSMGKTALALNMMYNMCYRYHKNAMIFSLEMSKKELTKRLIAMDSKINGLKLKTGKLADQEWDDLIQSIVHLGKGNLILDDTAGATVNQIRAKCRKQKIKEGLDIIFIDYLQLMSSEKSKENRVQEISEISRGLKALAREMNCPVIALSQLSRASEVRGGDHRPMLSDLRDSGAIEQDADVVLFLHRDDYYNKDSERPGEADIIIAKQRNGPLGDVSVLFNKETTKFNSIAY